MSTIDQPLLIATVNYHVGHTISIRVAEEQNFFHEEGLTDYVFDGRGLVPGPFERDAIALAMEEHGVDIAAGLSISAAIYQRSINADVYIVGGWRYDGPAGNKWFGAKHISSLGQLRGERVGIRERGAMDQTFLATALRRSGLDPDKDVDWICDPIFYGDDPRQLDELRSGRVTLVACRPPLWGQAQREGYQMLLDTTSLYPGGRPGKVIVATSRTIRDRADELKAFLRANIRAFWFVRNAANFEYLRDLESRLRIYSHNDFEHATQLLTRPEMAESWPMPLDGGVSKEELQRLIGEMLEQKQIDRPLSIDEVLHDDFVTSAYNELTDRPELGQAMEDARTAFSKYGY